MNPAGITEKEVPRKFTFNWNFFFFFIDNNKAPDLGALLCLLLNQFNAALQEAVKGFTLQHTVL